MDEKEERVGIDSHLGMIMDTEGSCESGKQVRCQLWSWRFIPFGKKLGPLAKWWWTKRASLRIASNFCFPSPLVSKTHATHFSSISSRKISIEMHLMVSCVVENMNERRGGDRSKEFRMKKNIDARREREIAVRTFPQQFSSLHVLRAAATWIS